MKRLYCYIFMFHQPLIILFGFRRKFDYMIISLTAFLFNMCINSQCLGTATWISALITPILEFRFLTLAYWTRVIPAVRKLTAYKFWFAFCAFKIYQSSPYLPIYILPFYLFLIIHKLYKSIQIEEPIRHVLSYNMPMKIYKYLSVRAHHPLILFICE